MTIYMKLIKRFAVAAVALLLALSFFAPVMGVACRPGRRKDDLRLPASRVAAEERSPLTQYSSTVRSQSRRRSSWRKPWRCRSHGVQTWAGMQHETAFSVFGGMPRASSIRILFADADYTVRLCTYAPNQVMPRHTHPTMGLSVVLAGDLAEEAEGSEEFAAPFSVVVKPAEVAHRNRFGPRGARLLSIELTAAFTDSLDANTVGLGRWRWCHDRARVPLGLHVGRLLREPLSARSEELDGLLAEFLAVFDETPALRQTPPTW